MLWNFNLFKVIHNFSVWWWFGDGIAFCAILLGYLSISFQHAFFIGRAPDYHNYCILVFVCTQQLNFKIYFLLPYKTSWMIFWNLIMSFVMKIWVKWEKIAWGNPMNFLLVCIGFCTVTYKKLLFVAFIWNFRKPDS